MTPTNIWILGGLILVGGATSNKISQDDRIRSLEKDAEQININFNELSSAVKSLQEKNAELEMTIVTTRKIMENRTLLDTFDIVGIIGSKIYFLEKDAINAASRGPMPSRSFTDSRKFCNEYGLRLATLKTDGEMKVVNDFVKLNDWLWPIWVGGKRVPWKSSNRPSYRWQSDRAGQELQVDFTHDPITITDDAYQNLRNGTSYEDCVMMYFSGFAGNGKFRDENCTKIHTPLCHKHLFSTFSDRRKIRRV
ncbi:uncharacterized protein LOC110850073 [Folsomia candida]|uniref:P-selectin n=1 Tax=Folsomia candida TaxID=158441 RepID=A0A226EA57_FOLCA|nr:uncharacterized protein LOC110850073 [Folsomia candida]OXA54339.1 P-selectin [Folsomia candida]